jgi:hypothetical protein
MRHVANMTALVAATAIAALLCGPTIAGAPPTTTTLNDGQAEELVRRPCQYVAMYNVNNKSAMKQGGWDNLVADDSQYVSLTITAYDHHVNIPMSTRLGDFRKPARMPLYSARAAGRLSARGPDRL